MLNNECCLKTMREMPENSVDLVVTSPPYGTIRSFGGNSGYDFKQTAHAIKRVLKPGGVCVWVVGDQVKDSQESGESARQTIYFIDEVKMNLFDTMIYQKADRAIGGRNGYWQCFEFMLVLSKGKPKTINLLKDRPNKTTAKSQVYTYRKDDKPYKKRAIGYGPFGRRTNVWKYLTGFNKSTRDLVAFEHPAIFPEQLALDHISSWSNEGDLIYDPFMGSGTVAKMAHLANRRWVGSEINPEYCDIVRRRLDSILI